MPEVSMSVLVPAVAALAGALIGSLAPIVVGVIQSSADHKRERMRLAPQLAIEDNRTAIELAKMCGLPAPIVPLSIYVAYHADVLGIVATGKPVTPADIAACRERSRALSQASRVESRPEAAKQTRNG